MSWAIVLGCSTGVGAATAKRLAQDGYDIVGFHRGRHHEEAHEVEAVVRATGRDSIILGSGAGANASEVNGAANSVKLLIGEQKVSVLVHAMSGASVGSAIAMAPAQVEHTMNVLAHSFLYWCKELQMRNLLQLNAHLVALSSPCPDFYLCRSGVIGAAKAALEAYVRILAAEFHGAAYVNCIRFSTVLTPALVKVLGEKAVAHLEDLHRLIVPRGYMATTDNIAAVISRQVQDPWTNGAVLDATGGAPMMLMDYAFHGPR